MWAFVKQPTSLLQCLPIGKKEMFLVRLCIGKAQLKLEGQKVIGIPAGIMITGHSKPFAAWHVVMVTF